MFNVVMCNAKTIQDNEDALVSKEFTELQIKA